MDLSLTSQGSAETHDASITLVNRVGGRRIVLSLVALILIAALMAAQVVVSRNNDAVMNRWYAREKNELTQRAVASERIAAIYLEMNATKGPGLTRRDAEEALNGGKPLPPGNHVSITDSVSGKPVDLIFAGNTWQGVMFLNTPTSAMPQWSDGMIAITAIRRLLYIAGYVAWGVLFVHHLITWRRRSRTVAIRRRIDLLMLAILSTLLLTVRHGYAHAWRNFFDDESGAWGLIMTPVSAALLVLALRPEKESRMHLCEQCGYDLTGNVSGICPECAWKLPPDRAAMIAQRTRTSRGSGAAEGSS